MRFTIDKDTHMKSFLKYTLASFIGVFIALVVLFLISLGSVNALLSTKPEETKVKAGSVLVLDLNKPITDRSIDDPFSFVDVQNMEMTGSLGLFDIIQNLDKAAQDPNVEGLLIQSGLMSPGIATLQEIRNAILAFKASGKFVMAYGDFYTQPSYYLATAADDIYVNPEGIIEFRGLRSEVMFYTQALEKIGVEVQVMRHGKFKSAVEPFLESEMSAASKEQALTYLNDLWGEMVTAIGESRELSADQLNDLANSFTIRDPKSALKHGFIDDLYYTDQLHNEIRERTGLSANTKVKTVSMLQYIHAPETQKKEYTSDRIAIIFGEGAIGMTKTGPTSIGGHHLAKAFRKARTDKRIKAIVFRINSPGGNVLASDIIRREVELAAAKKPVIISMGDLAASGGYWVSSPGKKILASPTTITGSIGVFGLWPNVEGLVTDKLGIQFDGVQTNDMAGMGSIFRPLRPEERAIIQGQIEATYKNFITRVADDRGMTPESVDSIGQGRVWSGLDALDLGLIDEYGGLAKAIDVAAQEAGLENYRMREMPQLKDPISELMDQLMGRKNRARQLLEQEIPAIRDLRECSQGGSIQARLPYTLIIK